VREGCSRRRGATAWRAGGGLYLPAADAAEPVARGTGGCALRTPTVPHLPRCLRLGHSRHRRGPLASWCPGRRSPGPRSQRMAHGRAVARRLGLIAGHLVDRGAGAPCSAQGARCSTAAAPAAGAAAAVPHLPLDLAAYRRQGFAVVLGLGRIVALYHRSTSALHQIH
jgi:hypothetical protein